MLSSAPHRPPRRSEARREMTDTKDPQKKREEIRVVDRRMFTNDGERRNPDAPVEEAIPSPALKPAPPQAVGGRGRAAGAAAPALASTSREGQIASAHFKNLILNLATT